MPQDVSDSQKMAFVMHVHHFQVILTFSVKFSYYDNDDEFQKIINIFHFES